MDDNEKGENESGSCCVAKYNPVYPNNLQSIVKEFESVLKWEDYVDRNIYLEINYIITELYFIWNIIYLKYILFEILK